MRSLLLFSLGVLPLLSSPLTAQRGTSNPHDAELRRFAAEARRAGRSPRAAIPLMEIEGLGDEASPGAVPRELGRLATERRLSPATRALAKATAAYALVGEGEFMAAIEDFEELGFVQRWRILGGFDDEGKQGFDRAYPPEEQRNDMAATDETAYRGREREIHWRDYPEDLARYGLLDLDATLRPNVNACAYAETFFHADEAKPMSVWAGAGGAVKVWVNGDEVIRDAVYRRGPSIDRTAAIFAAREGWNRLLVKVCVQDRRWALHLRLGEADGGPPSGVRIDPRGATVAAPAPANAPTLPAAPQSALAYFEQQVAENPEDAGAHFDLARFLSWTAAEDPTESRARQLAERAAELRPTVDHLLLAATLAESRAEEMRQVALAEAESPRDPRVLLARASLVQSGVDGGRALRLLESIPPTTAAGLQAQWQRATLLENRNLHRAGMALVVDGLRRTNGSRRWLRRRARALALAGRVDEATEARRALLAIEDDARDERFDLMGDAYERGDTDVLFQHLDHMRAIDPDDIGVLEYAAGVYEGLGRHDEALATYRQIIAYAPDEAEHHTRLGRALLRLGQQDAAIAAFRDVLALRPQDARTRQLLDRLQPSDREDESWATSTEELLARRTAQSRWPATILHDLQVATVFESGLASTFHQIAFQVHDDAGARSMSRFPIAYEPGRQWVEIRSAKVHRADGSVLENLRTFEQNLGDSRYRIYYDTRALVVALDLEPGDTVELRYRVDDVSRRNAFNDYYGDVRFLQGTHPVRRMEHVMVTPASREFYFNEPALEGLHHERTVEDGRRIDHFVANDIAPVRSEPSMPGPAETRPYLHVSTYQDWEAVGRWWWGLSRDQLTPDDGLIRTTRELVASASSEREKVRRIYDWVIRNTRYVGLEFGIHGFKPYRVTQIVQRGFGDCKDKASLIYAMLTIAGVDARIALIRTRRNGAIATAPASLAVFDHAIAYVPGLDLFLDGTAEMNGLTELPSMDQGVMTLLVGPESAELRTTPVLPADRQRRERILDVTLAADGSATVRGRARIEGDDASRYRSAFQAEGTRDERFQRDLGSIFPGIEVANQTFGDLDDFAAPVTFEWNGEVPQFAQRSADTLLVPPATLGNLVRNLARAPTRRHSLELGPPQSYVEVRTIHAPRGASIAEVPEGGEVESPFGRLSVRYSRQGADLEVRTEWEMRRDRIAQGEYVAYRQFVQSADALLRERVSVSVAGGAR